ncbi:RNA pseudouridylate synthase domain-containing protein 1-like [Liolophura sinensis]|uniref:RNA pseudouridylate synthase domain-containing protein 1-like n=1 Tax=Liolophura sinensis TaxID=3198878 RepID=UPI00315813EA
MARPLLLVRKLYRSPNYLAVNKDMDISINSDDRTQVTVESQLNATFPELRDAKVKHGFRFTHRLDYATSGVLCLSLNKKAAKHLHKAFADRNVVKHYLALVRGHVQVDKMEVDQALGKDGSLSFHKMCTPASPHCEGPRPAQTTLVRLETGQYGGRPATKLLLLPHTGRTHQLRVHCAHIGYPIIGDYTYTDRTDTEPYRMMLHSYRLITDCGLEHLDITAPDPFIPDMDELWQPDQVYRTYTQYSASMNKNSAKSEAHVNVCNSEIVPKPVKAKSIEFT